jgi:hypothetical protein
MGDHMYWFIQGVGAVVVGIALGVMVTMAVLWTWEGGHGRGKGEDPPADPPEPKPDWDAWLITLTDQERDKAPVIPALDAGPGRSPRASARRSARTGSPRFATKPASIGLWCWGPRTES